MRISDWSSDVCSSDLAVIAEIHLLQFRMPVETERFDDEGPELAGEEVGQEETQDIVGRLRLEGGIAPEEGVAVRPRDAGNALPFAEPVDIAAGAAIGIGEKDRLEPDDRKSVV